MQTHVRKFAFVAVALVTALYASQLSELQYQSRATVLFGGDMMFDRSIRTATSLRGGDYIFSCFDPLLKDKDLVIANLEGPITDSSSVSQFSIPEDSNNFTFTFPTSTAALLFAHNIRMVNLGNNHILNFKRDGLLLTKNYLRDAGVGFFGDPDVPESGRVARVDIKGVPFSFVNWSDWRSDSTALTTAQIRSEAADGRVVVVYTHWGEEYVPPTNRMIRLAHAFVDEGASIVVGSHPHVVQIKEEYKGKLIYYSLGNMIFDQYFDEAVTHGLMLEVTFNHSGVERIQEHPIILLPDRRTCPYPYRDQ